MIVDEIVFAGTAITLVVSATVWAWRVVRQQIRRRRRMIRVSQRPARRVVLPQLPVTGADEGSKRFRDKSRKVLRYREISSKRRI